MVLWTVHEQRRNDQGGRLRHRWVLERIDGPEAFASRWRTRLGMTADEFDAAVGQVDRAVALRAAPTEQDLPRCWMDALGLSPREGDEFMRDLWDWYCGDGDHELMAFAIGLRPRYATAILSDSGRIPTR